MPDNKTDNKETPEQKKAREQSEADTKKVTDFLNDNKLDIRSQLLIVLENGQTVPIRGITAQAFVVKQDGFEQQAKSDTGSGKA